MKNNYFAVQYRSKTEPYKYRAEVIQAPSSWNLLWYFMPANPAEELITINCWPKKQCEKIVEEWNEQYKSTNRYLDK